MRSMTKVIVVEDEFLVRLDVALQLEDEGFEVIAAGTADEALALLPNELPIDVVFTDVNMPGELDGLQLAQRIHQHWPHVKVIVTSGRRINPDKIPDHFPFLAKPYDVRAVVDVVNELVKR